MATERHSHGMDLVCWQCGEQVTGVIMPLSRRETCTHCLSELHSCRQCEHYDPRISDQCREDRAEQVSRKSVANFCDYFKLNDQPKREADKSSEVSPELAALFGLNTDDQ